ncbi:hypothetical protein NDU88_005693 [Pleurodeles waltl]|uniref:Uncharacterized protein n=1 Tax=Pleurodeles waltl TaxID=8319 RepID=A0AAV7MAS6_PLEWA|nr:hypothetical protein NDU88_005693 [Pleurodeles waltl]
MEQPCSPEEEWPALAREWAPWIGPSPWRGRPGVLRRLALSRSLHARVGLSPVRKTAAWRECPGGGRASGRLLGDSGVGKGQASYLWGWPSSPGEGQPALARDRALQTGPSPWRGRPKARRRRRGHGRNREAEEPRTSCDDDPKTVLRVPMPTRALAPLAETGAPGLAWTRALAGHILGMGLARRLLDGGLAMEERPRRCP